MAFAVRGCVLLRAPAGSSARSASARLQRRAAAPLRRAACAPRAALPSVAPVDGLIGLALAPFALKLASVTLAGVLSGGLATSVSAAAVAVTSVRSVPLAASVLLGGVLALERDAIAAKLAGPLGGVVRGIAALGAAALAFGFVYATQARRWAASWLQTSL